MLNLFFVSCSYLRVERSGEGFHAVLLSSLSMCSTSSQQGTVHDTTHYMPTWT